MATVAATTIVCAIDQSTGAVLTVIKASVN
jgi:hypothetical protein